MTPARYEQVRALFLEACGLVPAELGPFLDRACADDPELRQEVISLLVHVETGDVIEPRPPTADPLRLEGVELDGRYRVETYVTSGGFSHVYRGLQLAWGMPVAIKLLKQSLPAADREALQDSFVREGALQVQLSRRTPAIVQAYDLGTWTSPRGQAITYTVMEWLEGRALAAEIAERPRRWPLAEVVTTLGPVAVALSVAHDLGIAHRDLKPDNIFLCQDGPARLLDFGIAKLAAEYSRGFDATSALRSPFTAAYAAPEQADRRFGVSSPATDVHGLALVCCELLAGQRPYRGETGTDLLRQAVDPQRRPTPRALGVDVSPAVEAVFARALALKPASRYPDAGTFWRELEAAATEPPKKPRRWLRLRG